MIKELEPILKDILLSSSLGRGTNKLVRSNDNIVSSEDIIKTTNQLFLLKSLKETTLNFEKEKNENLLLSDREDRIETLNGNESNKRYNIDTDNIIDLLNRLGIALEDLEQPVQLDRNSSRIRKRASRRRPSVRRRVQTTPRSEPTRTRNTEVRRPTSRSFNRRSGFGLGMIGAGAITSAPALALSSPTNNIQSNFINSISTTNAFGVGAPSSPQMSSNQSLTGPAPMAGGAIPGDYGIAGRMGVSPQEWDIYRNTIAEIESGGRYDIVGGSGNAYDGRYQMYGPAKQDGARWSGARVPSTREEFRRNPQIQETLFAGFTLGNNRTLERNERYKRMSPRERLVILGYAHNQGAGAALRWLRTGVAGRDGFGTLATKYSDRLSANLLGGSAAGSQSFASNMSGSPMNASQASGIISSGRSLLGMNERTNRNEINSFFRSSGVNLDVGLEHWCAAFVSATLIKNGFPGAPNRSNMARSFLNYGVEVPLGSQQPGDIVVFSRGINPTSGHVAFYISETATHFRVLGGNQGARGGGEVSETNYPKRRLLGIRRPNGVSAAEGVGGMPAPPAYNLAPVFSLLFPGLIASSAERVSDAQNKHSNSDQKLRVEVGKQTATRSVAPQLKQITSQKNAGSEVSKPQSPRDQYKSYFRVA